MRYLIQCEACGHVTTRRDYDGEHPFDTYYCDGCDRRFKGDLPHEPDIEGSKKWSDDEEEAVATVLQYPLGQRLGPRIEMIRIPQPLSHHHCSGRPLQPGSL